jgi:3-methyladenine DNA glycosylase AlkD
MAGTDRDQRLRTALALLGEKSTSKDRQNLARFGIDAPTAIGVSMADIQAIAKRLGRDHGLALALWESKCYEARLLASFVDDPAQVTPAQMDRWCREFDNWAVCDTVCFKLFDRTPHAWDKVARWRKSRVEFVKRAAFALLASLAGHDKSSPAGRFSAAFPWIEEAATDDRNFVRKGVSWALRRIGTRSPALKTEALAVAKRLSESPAAAARWIGRDALRDLSKGKRA